MPSFVPRRWRWIARSIVWSVKMVARLVKWLWKRRRRL
jgi:hypothetical protein